MFCADCFEKQREIDKLKAENARLKAKLHYQERNAKEGAFGSSTPSSKIPIKPSKTGDSLHGGAKNGHKGHGRGSHSENKATKVERVSLDEEYCPACQAELEQKGYKDRTVIDCTPVQKEKILYELEQKRCPRCNKVLTAKAPSVLPKMLFGTELLSYISVQHYFYGMTIGTLCNQLGLNEGSIFSAMHQLAEMFKHIPDRLIELYRAAKVKHADETGWRTDGVNGYTWIFCTTEIIIFRFRATRAAQVPHEVFGDQPVEGVLVVDRYNGYNNVPCAIQYCYAHLLRDVKDLEKDFPDVPEVSFFVNAFAPLLCNAMKLRSLGHDEGTFLHKATELKNQIIDVVNSPASHPGIQKIQNIFRENSSRLYHWAQSPLIPAENNLAERSIRPLVIARKISHGSQSSKGAATRETLMTVLHSLAQKTNNIFSIFKKTLDALVRNKTLDPLKLLFLEPPSG